MLRLGGDALNPVADLDGVGMSVVVKERLEVDTLEQRVDVEVAASGSDTKRVADSGFAELCENLRDRKSVCRERVLVSG